MSRIENTAYAMRQPRFTATGKLACAVCWHKNKDVVVLNGDLNCLRCYRCGTQYVQKPFGLSFSVIIPDSIREEANAESVASLKNDREIALSKKLPDNTSRETA